MVALPLLASETGDGKAWDDFLKWFRAAGVMNSREEVMRAYAAKLKAEGASEEQAKQHLAGLARIAEQRQTDLLATHFDRLFSSPQPVFRTTPSAYLERMIAGHTPGKALDVAMGQGRNSVFLAKSGWSVTGYDISTEGMNLARTNAEKAGVTLHTVPATHAEFDYGTEQWDLIVMVFSFTPMSDPAFLKRVRDGLKPGGMVVVEQFNAPASSPSAKGPANALFKSFEGLRVVDYQDVVDTSDWVGKPSRIGRLTAIKE
jgi:2-polyprenyl-3-methyl-5-hydroxy-6-metoxy-1,4-benzoquinol methylase